MTSIVNIHKIHGKRPAFDVYIGRAVKGTEFTNDSIWANTFTLDKYSLEDSLRFYEERIRTLIRCFPATYNILALKGKILGCWCIATDKFDKIVCHGQILLKILWEIQHVSS